MITEEERAELRALADRVRDKPAVWAKPFRLLAALVDENDELLSGDQGRYTEVQRLRETVDAVTEERDELAAILQRVKAMIARLMDGAA